jgi:predicted RNase H-like nuclease
VDDLLDACAAGWSAHRISTAAAERAPAEPDLDARGLRMEISW